MIPKKQLNEIKNYLGKSENPLIFFDDDPDGLCSFLLLGKIKSSANYIPVKANKLDERFLKKVHELSPDVIFILDCPVITQDFVDKIHVPIIWLDHHPPIKIGGVHYYNPRIKDKGDRRPITYWCYKITGKNLWVATIGTVADYFIPEFIKDFCEKYPDLIEKEKRIEGMLYNTKLGQLIKIFAFSLKGKTEDVKKNLELLIKIKEPYEILDKTTPNGKLLIERVEKIEKQYNSLLTKALEELKDISKKDKILIFLYPSSKMSFTSELSNELLYRFPDKLIIVGREKNGEIKLSLRSNNLNLQKILEKALYNIEGYGGGHEQAVGANVAKRDFYKFIEAIKEQL